MPNFIRHMLGYMPTNIVQMGVAFGSVFVFTRLLSDAGYGQYALALTTLHLLHTLSLTWIEAAGYRFAAEAKTKDKLASHYRVSLALILLGLLPALLLLGAVLLLMGSASDMRGVLVWLFVILPTSVIVNLAQENHRAGQRVARFSAVEISRVLGSFIIGIVLAWATGFGAASPMIGMAFATSILAVTEGYWLWKNSRTGRVTSADMKRHARYGIPVAAALVLSLILSASDRFLIAYFLDTAAVGAYAAGYGVADKTILFLCAWIAMGGAPLVLAAYEKEGEAAAREEAKSLIQMMLLLAVPATVGIVLVVSPLSEVMIGAPLRAEAEAIIPWIAFAGLLNGLLIHYFSESFQLAHKTLEHALIMIIPTVFNIALNILLLPRLGLMGAVYATLASYGLAIILIGALGRRHLALPLPVFDLAKIALACAGMAIIVPLIPDMQVMLELVVKASIGAIVYAGCVVLTNACGARALFLDVYAKIKSRTRKAPEPGTPLN